MAYSDVRKKLVFQQMSAADRKVVKELIKNAYQNSPTAREMFDDFIAVPGNKIRVKHVENEFAAFAGFGKILIDLDWLNDNTFIDNNGKAVPDTPTTGVIHELVHALTGLTDNWTMKEYKGDTVKLSNLIYKELGLSEQNSYIAYDSEGDLLQEGKNYTNKQEIDRSFVADESWNSSRGGNKDDLLIGGNSANRLVSGAGDDFIYGAGGDDMLKGQKGNDQIDGNFGNDKIDGGQGKDTLNGGQGDDTLTGGENADVFEFRKNHGEDVITDYTDGKDKLDVSALGVKFEDLEVDQVGDDVVVDTSAGTITLVNTSVDDIDASDFLF